MLTSFPIAISVIEEIDGVYIYKYINNTCSTLFKVDANECIDKPIGFSYSGDYNGESNFYSLVNVFFKSHKKELHSVIPVQYLQSLDEGCRLLGITNAYKNGVLQMYIIAISVDSNRAVFFASVQPFVTTVVEPSTSSDFMLLINKLDVELERINKTLYYGNGNPALTSRIASIELSIVNASNTLKELQSKLYELEDGKIEQLEENTYWLSILTKIVKGRWLLITLFFFLSLALSLDIDKLLIRNILRPVMEGVIKGGK